MQYSCSKNSAVQPRSMGSSFAACSGSFCVSSRKQVRTPSNLRGYHAVHKDKTRGEGLAMRRCTHVTVCLSYSVALHVGRSADAQEPEVPLTLRRFRCGEAYFGSKVCCLHTAATPTFYSSKLTILLLNTQLSMQKLHGNYGR